MNEWGEYRIYGEAEDYHRKVYPLDKPDCTIADIEAYPYPDLSAAYRYEGLAEAIRDLHDRGLAAVLSWEMTIFEKAWRIRGLEELLMDLVLAPALAEALFDQVAMRTGAFAARVAELGVDIIQLGDDVGSQTGMLISPRLWRRTLKSRMADLIAGIKRANPDTLVFYHTDGIVDPVIPDFIEIGIDILNPVQPECMDVGRLKREYGQHLAFWGGVGVQTTMPFGTPDDVRAATRQVIEEAGAGGGLLVAPAHLIERDIPWENVLAFVEAVQDHGAYD
jgi:uroporphyrinogen decarboxylase